jgi:hypothetical protein
MHRILRLGPITFGLWLSLSALAQSARADACFGGDHPEPPAPAVDGGEDGATGGRPAPGSQRLAGGSLIFLSGLASIWMSARRKERPPRQGSDPS